MEGASGIWLIAGGLRTAVPFGGAPVGVLVLLARSRARPPVPRSDILPALSHLWRGYWMEGDDAGGGEDR